ncbi:unnamed protein product [Dicrocoelium dendriticum]|nr:unnamed protein product [Dicrocoelium dendriticum]
MFPNLQVRISGLIPESKYLIALDCKCCDMNRYRYSFQISAWIPAGKADANPSARMHLHTDGLATGAHWMRQTVLFDKLKLTNNPTDQNDHLVLNSMHKFQPRLHIIYVSSPSQHKPDSQPAQNFSLLEVAECSPWKKTFVFPETQFFAVTAYQNHRITQLKIQSNPFAKGFRECEAGNSSAYLPGPRVLCSPSNTNKIQAKRRKCKRLLLHSD